MARRNAFAMADKWVGPIGLRFEFLGKPNFFARAPSKMGAG